MKLARASPRMVVVLLSCLGLVLDAKAHNFQLFHCFWQQTSCAADGACPDIYDLLGKAVMWSEDGEWHGDWYVTRYDNGIKGSNSHTMCTGNADRPYSKDCLGGVPRDKGRFNSMTLFWETDPNDIEGYHDGQVFGHMDADGQNSFCRRKRNREVKWFFGRIVTCEQIAECHN